MKKFFNLRKSALMLLTILALLGGTNQAWADAYTCGFEASEGWSTEKISWVQYTTVGNDWSTIGGSTLAYYNVSEGSSYKRTGSQSLTHNASTENTSYYAVTPYLAAGTISFYARYAQSTYNLKIFKASFDGEAYVLEELITSWSKTGTKLTNSFSQYSFELDEDCYVAILLDRVAMDDFSAPNGTTIPSGIAKPRSFSASNITANSADLSWVAGSSETNWELSYSTVSGDPDNGTIVPLTSTSYSLTGLTAETTYYASVRAKIDNEYSVWTKEISFTPTRSIKMTVNDGTVSNSYLPIYGYYANYYEKTEFVVPDTSLTDMTNSDIKALTFYLSSVASKSWGNANFKIYMKEIDATTISNFTFTEEDTPLYSGPIDGTKTETTIVLTTPYSYNGGNLLIGIYNTEKGTYASATFYGVTAEEGVAIYGTNSSSLANITTAYKQSFLPKTTFTYLPADGAVMKVSDKSINFGTITEESTDAEKTKTFKISNKGNATLENISVSYSGDNVFSLSDNIATSIEANGDDIIVTVTMAASTSGNYSGTITVSATGQTDAIITLEGIYSADPASMTITLDEEAVGETVAFGEAGKSITKTFTIKNDGNLTLFVSLASDNTADFTVSPAELEVAGKSSETFTVTFVYDAEALNAEKSANITITPSNEGLDPFTFAVTGTRIEMWSEDFSGNALPEGWETTSEKYWTFADGYAHGAFQQSNYYLITPSIVVEEGASLSFDVRGTTSYTTMTIEKQKDNGDWTEVRDITYPDIDRTLDVWKSFTIDNLEAGNYKFRFNARGYDLDNFEGFKRNTNAPKLGIYTDEECTVAATMAEKKNFGFVKDAQTATYYIKNIGSGTMELAKGDAPSGFTATLDKTAVLANEYATLTIQMPAEENTGFHNGNVSVNAGDLGTFTVSVVGVIVDEQKLHLDFATDTIPGTWTANSWEKNEDGYIEVGYASEPVVLETNKLIAKDGEELVVLARQSSTWMDYSFGVKYKKEDAEEWTELIPAANIGTNYVMLHGTIAEAGTYQLQFNGQYTQIQHIYGLEEVKDPVVPSSIADVARTKAAQPVYNLSGQRVAKPQHGLYIQNGRKVVKR